MLSKLIEALQILNKYGDPVYPTWCEHDCLHACDIDPADVSEEDKKKLNELGFPHDEEHFYSFKYGSA